MSKPHIPVFENEVVIARAKKQWLGETDKVATTSVGDTDYEGINVASRYSKAHEMQLMFLMIDGVSPFLRKHIVCLFCDSKATAVYEVRLKKPIDPRLARTIGEQMAAVCKAKAGGHNGVYVSNQTMCDIEIGADWGEIDW